MVRCVQQRHGLLFPMVIVLLTVVILRRNVKHFGLGILLLTVLSLQLFEMSQTSPANDVVSERKVLYADTCIHQASTVA